MERRRILRQYFLSLTVIFCVLLFFAGIITVSQRTRYNMELTEYEGVSFVRNVKGLEITLGDRELFIKSDDIENMGKNAFYSLMGDVFADMSEFFEKNVN